MLDSRGDPRMQVKPRHVLPFIFFPVLVIALFELGAVTYGERHEDQLTAPELTVIPPEDVPLALRDLVWPSIVNPVWHLCYEQDGYTIAVRTYEQLLDLPPRGPRSESCVEFVVYRDSGSGLTYVAHHTQSAEALLGSRYVWRPGEAGGSVMEWQDRTHYALGWAFSGQAVAVVGTTTSGRQFRAPIVDGFWFLRVVDHVGPEVFSSAVVQDDQGNTIFEYPARVFRP